MAGGRGRTAVGEGEYLPSTEGAEGSTGRAGESGRPNKGEEIGKKMKHIVQIGGKL